MRTLDLGIFQHKVQSKTIGLLNLKNLLHKLVESVARLYVLITHECCLLVFSQLETGIGDMSRHGYEFPFVLQPFLFIEDLLFQSSL